MKKKTKVLDFTLDRMFSNEQMQLLEFKALNKVELVCSICSSIIFFLWFIITVWLNIYNPSSYANGVDYDTTGGVNGGL